MNNKIFKIVFSLIVMIASLFAFQTICNAASFSASISSTSVNVGDTFTVTVKASNAAGMYSVTNNNSNVSVVSGSKSEFLENGSTSVKFKAVKAGSVTIVAKSVDMTDLDNSEKPVSGSKKFNVTIKEKSSNSNKSSSSSSSSSNSTQKPSFTSTNQKVYAKDNINLRSSWSTSSRAIAVKKGTEMTLTGKSSKTVNGYVWCRVSYNGATKYVSRNLVTTTKPTDTKSDEKEEEKKDSSKATSTKLKSLTVTPTGLSPAFNTGTTEYTMTVGSNIDGIEVKAVAEDSNASIKVEGNKNLTIGKNKITITVTAGEDTKTYNINVTKDSKKQLQLSELLIDGQLLVPEFDSNIHEYTIKKADTSELNITATPSSSSAEVEILGNTNFQVGENIVTILVKSSNGEEVTTYQITVNIAQSDAIAVDDNSNSDNKKMYLYIGLGVVGVIILIIIIVYVKNHKKDDDVKNVNLYNGMYNPRGNDEKDVKDNKPSVGTNTLTKLDNEDLPKSLKKNDFEKKLEEKQSKMSEKKQKIDEFYNIQDDNTREKRKGKHSK